METKKEVKGWFIATRRKQLTRFVTIRFSNVFEIIREAENLSTKPVPTLHVSLLNLLLSPLGNSKGP